MPFPQQPSSPDVTASPITQFFDGVGERLVDIVPEIAVGILVSNLSAPASTLYRARPGELDTNGAGERAINAVNEALPNWDGATSKLKRLVLRKMGPQKVKT